MSAATTPLVIVGIVLASSVGIEIDETLAEYSRLNTAGVNAKIDRASVETFDFRELGKFDLITCTEVIEHVRNPPYLVKTISGLLETGGTLFLRVPNGRSVNFVCQDGHFLLFGICLLSRQEAKEFKLQTTSSLDDYEHMGEYFQRGYYANLLLANRIDATILDSLPENCLSDVPARASAAVSAFQSWSASPGKVSALQQTLLSTAFAEYMEQFWGNYGRVLRGTIDLPSFYVDYLQDFWTFIGVKRC